MSTTVSHPLPSAQAQAIADLTGYEDAATLRWQQACVQAANTLTALPNGRYVNVRMERMRQGLELAQRGAVTLPEDERAVQRRGAQRQQHLPDRHPPAHLHLCGLPEALAGLQAPAGGRKSTWERWGSCRPPHQSRRPPSGGARARQHQPATRHPARPAGPSAKRPPRSTSSSRSATWNSCTPCAMWTT